MGYRPSICSTKDHLIFLGKCFLPGFYFAGDKDCTVCFYVCAFPRAFATVSEKLFSPLRGFLLLTRQILWGTKKRCRSLGSSRYWSSLSPPPKGRDHCLSAPWHWRMAFHPQILEIWWYSSFVSFFFSCSTFPTSWNSDSSPSGQQILDSCPCGDAYGFIPSSNLPASFPLVSLWCQNTSSGHAPSDPSVSESQKLT